MGMGSSVSLKSSEKREGWRLAYERVPKRSLVHGALSSNSPIHRLLKGRNSALHQNGATQHRISRRDSTFVDADTFGAQNVPGVLVHQHHC